MGMFDYIRDRSGRNWQTRAYLCLIDVYEIGDKVPGGYGTYQVEIYGGYPTEDNHDSYALVRNNVLVDLPVARNRRLPLLGYYGEFNPKERPYRW